MNDKSKDNVFKLIKVATNLIPFIGGAVASIIGDYHSSRKEKRIEEFLVEFNKKITNNQEKIVIDYINNDDFLDIFENIYRSILNERQNEKRIAYRNVLANSMLTNGTSYEDTEEFQYLISILKIKSFSILNVFNKLNKFESENLSVDPFVNRILKAIESESGIADEGLIVELIEELEAHRLVKGFLSNYYARGGNGGFVWRVDNFTTDKGKRFLTYILN